MPLEELPALIALAHRVRLAWCGPEVELESLINAKSGACAEDCAFCSQSAHFDTGVDVYPFLDLDEVIGAAEAPRRRAPPSSASWWPSGARASGCWTRSSAPSTPSSARPASRWPAPSGCSTPSQAGRLAAAGVRRYNHNLEACRATFARSARPTRYDDRVATARLAIDAGMELCCGGILGMGETLEQRVDFAFELAELGPGEVPLNLLDPRPGTPLADTRS